MNITLPCLSIDFIMGHLIITFLRPYSILFLPYYKPITGFNKG